MPAAGRALWQAPRTAYQMTALLAEEDRLECFQLWASLSAGDQLDVLRALGAQARNALLAAGDAGWDLDPAVLRAIMADGGFAVAAEAAMALVKDEYLPVPGIVDRAGAALLLNSMIIGCWRKAGLSAGLIAHHCREAAAL